MKTDTLTVALDGAYEDIFAFLADPENLPLWAVGFARAVRREGSAWTVSTAHGEIGLRTLTDAATGVIDWFMTAAPGVESRACSRLVPTPGGTLYMFSLIQWPGMSHDEFAAQAGALREELEVLRHLFRARAACPS